MTGGSPDPTSVDFHFDVMCPYAYQTSKWIRSVRDEIGIEINWRFFSLEDVNRAEGKKHPWEREWSYGWSLLRVGAMLRRTSMDDLDRWYEIAGRTLHEEGRPSHRPDVARHLLAEIGLEPDVVDRALADETTHDDIKADHERVITAGGYGVPTLFFGEHCLFGPVLVDPPSGDAAVRLWRAVTAWLEFPDLFELQQPKDQTAQRRIVQAFEPYLQARDWVSVNRGVEVGFTQDGIVAVGPFGEARS